MNIKVTFEKFIKCSLVGFSVFLITRCYYISKYIERSEIQILPSEPVISISLPEENKTVIKFADDSLESKFVSSKAESSLDQTEKKTNSKKVTSEQLHVQEIDQVIHSSNDESWVKAGQPYIVPQLKDSERQIKIKRYLAPQNGAENGH